MEIDVKKEEYLYHIKTPNLILGKNLKKNFQLVPKLREQ
jgi:hypothetical protein